MALTKQTGPPRHDLGTHFVSAFRCSSAPACPRTLLTLTRGLVSHLHLGPVLSPWTCPMITGLCLTLVTWLRPSPDPGLQNGFPACLQTCLVTMNLLHGLWAAPGLPWWDWCQLPGLALGSPRRSGPHVPQAAQKHPQAGQGPTRHQRTSLAPAATSPPARQQSA